MRYDMSPKQLICSIYTIHVQSRCTSCISLDVKNIFIQSKLHTYQNIATKKAHAGVCNLIKKSSIKIHIPGQDGNFRKYTGSLANFIAQNHTYDAEMSLQWRIHNCRIQVTAFRQLSGCALKIIFDIIQRSFCLNMAQAECLVSSTVNFPQKMVCQWTLGTSAYAIQTWASQY